jgi:TM2 domain-containing membrane protein YozV
LKTTIKTALAVIFISVAAGMAAAAEESSSVPQTVVPAVTQPQQPVDQNIGAPSSGKKPEGAPPADTVPDTKQKKASQRNQPYKTMEPHKEVSMAVAVTLTYLPGFGAGHFYAGDTNRGITYLVVDTAIWGFGISSFIMQVLSTAPTYTKVALILFPIIFAGMKAVETVDIVRTVEVENNRSLRPAGMMEYDSSTTMTTVARF